MTISNTAELDRVLEEYALASEGFDATVLNIFLGKYPEYAAALRRYAQVQLTFVQPTREEVEAEELTDAEMLPQQSKLLQRMQQLRGSVSSEDVDAASRKLSGISGEVQLLEVSQVVFGSSDHGEDLLLVSVTDSPVPIDGVPDFFYEGLGHYVGHAPPVVVQALARQRQAPFGAQRFSTQGKPAAPPPVTWKKLVEDCISDDEAIRKILERSERS